MRVAIVHDYIKEYGGAERVLSTLTEMYPDAPIYTAFRVKDSTADKEFNGKKIIESWLSPLLKIWRLYSPLRFLAPVIWSSFDLSEYDLVITSCSWYITRGFRVGKNTQVIAYCHTPPRWLYGYDTSVGFTKYWPVKIYSAIIGYFMKIYDYKTAQEVDYFIANSNNVKNRIAKFYNRDSYVIYPPVEVEKIVNSTKNIKKEDYFLIVSRLVGAKGLEFAAEISKKLNIKLKIVGESHGFADVEKNIKKISGGNIELLGRLNDSELYVVLAKAKCFFAFAKDEDFGMTVVESQAAGTPVVAFNGGGFKESVVDGLTGILINEVSEESITDAISRFENTKWDKVKLINNATKFSKEKFKIEMLQFIKNHTNMASSK